MTTLETIKNLQQVPTGVWYPVYSRSGDDLTPVIKEMIDSGEHFQFDDEYKRYKKLEDLPTHAFTDVIGHFNYLDGNVYQL